MSDNAAVPDPAASSQQHQPSRKAALIALADGDGDVGCYWLCLETARLLLKEEEGIDIHILVGPSNRMGSVLALELLGRGGSGGGEGGATRSSGAAAASITFHWLELDDSGQVDMFCQQTIPTLGGIAYQVNIVGAMTSFPPSFCLWFLTQAVAKSMVHHRNNRNSDGISTLHAGSIVNAASSCSFSSPLSNSHDNFRLFSQHLAMDLAEHGICVNSVWPARLVPATTTTTSTTTTTTTTLQRRTSNQQHGGRGPPAASYNEPNDNNKAKKIEAFLQSYAVVAFLLSERAGWLTAANSKFSGGVHGPY